MPSRPAISVIIPAYNRVGSIRAAVDSVLGQTLTDLELLVVDDGSTDGTMDALADIADPRLKRLATPRNMGASGARNTGIRAAVADWVAFQDSDDEWMPRKLEKQMARLAAAPPDTVACYCGMAIVGSLDHHGTGRISVSYIPEPNVEKVEGDLRRQILYRSLVSTQMLVARRDQLLDIGGFDESLPAIEDWECVIRLSQRGPFAFVDEPLVLQYFSDNSITRSMEKRMRARALILDKHAGLFAAEPQALVRQLVSLSGERRKLGDMPGSRAAMSAARRLRPTDPTLWLRTLRLLRPGQRPPLPPVPRA